MTEFQIERLAEMVLAGHGLGDLPVDPLALARLEKIRLAPGGYDRCFEGRIEYRQGRFYLFYAEADPPGRPLSRVRFSVAHELGHFFIPAHRDYLVSGHWLGRRQELVSTRRLEREADWFAAALLMPRQAFIDQVQSRWDGLCRLADLRDLADEVFQTSLVSTALRYVQLNFQACCVVVAEEGKVQFSFRSDEMKRQGYGWLVGIPPRSLTGQAATPLADPLHDQGDVALWYEGAPSRLLWEDVMAIEGTQQTLTLLVLEPTAAREEW